VNRIISIPVALTLAFVAGPSFADAPPPTAEIGHDAVATGSVTASDVTADLDALFEGCVATDDDSVRFVECPKRHLGMQIARQKGDLDATLAMVRDTAIELQPVQELADERMHRHHVVLDAILPSKIQKPRRALVAINPTESDAETDIAICLAQSDDDVGTFCRPALAQVLSAGVPASLFDTSRHFEGCTSRPEHHGGRSLECAERNMLVTIGRHDAVPAKVVERLESQADDVRTEARLESLDALQHTVHRYTMPAGNEGLMLLVRPEGAVATGVLMCGQIEGTTEFDTAWCERALTLLGRGRPVSPKTF